MTYEYDHSLMFRLHFDENADQALFDWMDTWLTNFEPWEDDAHGPNELPTLREPIEEGREPYYSATWWFSWAEDKAHIYDDLIDATESMGYLVSYADWCRVGYHDCTHPGGGGPCSWDEQREHGTVPDHIGDMSPDGG